MPLPRAHIDAVLADLKRSREILLVNLAEVEGVIESLEQLYVKAPLLPLSPLGSKALHQVEEAQERGFQEKKQGRPKKVKTVERIPGIEQKQQRREEVRAAFAERDSQNEPEPEPEPEPVPSPPPQQPVAPYGLVGAIIKAAREIKHDQARLARRVLEIRPGTSNSSAQTQISTMLKDGRLHKGNDLIIRNVVDGKIENLPPTLEKDSLTPHRFSQYDKK